MLSLYSEGSRGSEKTGLCHIQRVRSGEAGGGAGMVPPRAAAIRNEGLVPVLALTLGDPASACL